MKTISPVVLCKRLQEDLGISEHRASEGIRRALEKGDMGLGKKLRFHMNKLSGETVTRWSRELTLTETDTGILVIDVRQIVVSGLSQRFEHVISVPLEPSHALLLRDLLNQYLDTNGFHE